MTPRLVLVTGGCRSGKSAFAQRYVEERFAESPKIYLATCPVLDDEIAARINRHQRERDNRNWSTIEEQTDIVRALAGAPEGPVLIDCLTLWTSNHMHRAEQSGKELTEDSMAVAARAAAAACVARGMLVVAVTNEVGMGIVPENRVARQFRDLAGRVNQAFAAAADEVHLLVSGLPIRIK